MEIKLLLKVKIQMVTKKLQLVMEKDLLSRKAREAEENLNPMNVLAPRENIVLLLIIKKQKKINIRIKHLANLAKDLVKVNDLENLDMRVVKRELQEEVDEEKHLLLQLKKLKLPVVIKSYQMFKNYPVLIIIFLLKKRLV